MFLFKKIFFLIVVINLYGCGSKPEFFGDPGVGNYSYSCKESYTGKIEVFDEITKIKVKELQIKDGKLHGKSTTWNKNGKMIEQCDYYMGEHHGFTFVWNERGQKIEENKYTNGKQDGSSFLWRENGSLETESKYKLGEQISHTHWDEEGFKYNEVTYQSGRLLKMEWWKKNGEYSIQLHSTPKEFHYISYKKNGDKKWEYKSKNGISYDFKSYDTIEELKQELKQNE